MVDTVSTGTGQLQCRGASNVRGEHVRVGYGGFSWGLADGTCRGNPTGGGGSRGWLVALPTGLRHHQTGETRNSWVIAPQYTEMPLVDAWKGSVIPVRVCSLTEGADVHALGEGDLAIDYLGDIAQDEAVLPPEFDVAQFWVETKSRVERFISQHGHSRVPRDYHDEDGRLGGLVGNIRWFVAGRGGLSPGPFPGIDLVTELDELEGWDWELDD